MLSEVKRLRPHYLSSSALDVGRRQMLDYFEEYLNKNGPNKAIIEAIDKMIAETSSELVENASWGGPTINKDKFELKIQILVELKQQFRST